MIVCEQVARFFHGHQADEYLGEVWIVLQKVLVRYDPRKSTLRTYLSVAYRNHLCDVARANFRRRIVNIPPMGDECDFLDTLPARSANGDEVELPEVREEAILLFARGLTLREIAAVLGIPEGTVKSRMNRERERLSGGRRARRRNRDA